MAFAKKKKKKKFEIKNKKKTQFYQTVTNLYYFF